MPSTLTRVERNAFYFAKNINLQSFTDRLQYIGESAFCGASGIGNDTLFLSDQLDSVPKNALLINGLNCLVIPKNLQYVGDYAFSGVQRDVVFRNTKSYLEMPNNFNSTSSASRAHLNSQKNNVSNILSTANSMKKFSQQLNFVTVTVPSASRQGGQVDVRYNPLFRGDPYVLADDTVRFTITPDASHELADLYATCTVATKIGVAGSTEPTITQGKLPEELKDGNPHEFWFVQPSQNSTTYTVRLNITYNKLPEYYVSVSVSNYDCGEVSGSGYYTQGTTATLTATPKRGYHFTAWQDGNTDNPRQVSVKQDTSFTATFEPDTYVVNAVPNDSTLGSVSGGGTYEYGTRVSLVATPAAKCEFTGWSNGVTDRVYNFTVTQDTTLVANFVRPDVYYTLMVQADDNARGTTTGGGTYKEGSTATLTATPLYGYHFTAWQDGSKDNPRTVTVNDNMTYTASFEPNNYTVSVSSNNEQYGSVTGGGTYTYGQQATLTATPASRCEFQAWSNGVTDQVYTLTVTQDTTLVASFIRPDVYYTLTVQSADNSRGTTSGGGSYKENTTATLTATPLYGYHFTAWQDGSTDNPRTVTVSEDMTYTASFEPNNYTVSVSSDNEQAGTVTGGGTFTYLQTVTVNATPNEGYKFYRWSDGSQDQSYSFTLTRDTSLVAQFVSAQAKTFTITTESSNSYYGITYGGGEFIEGDSVTLYTWPTQGCSFLRWEDGNTDNPRSFLATADGHYRALFARDESTFELFLYSHDNGNTQVGSNLGAAKIDVADNGGCYSNLAYYPYGAEVSITATPYEGADFIFWRDGFGQLLERPEVTASPRTVRIVADTFYIATFASVSEIGYVSIRSDNEAQGRVYSGEYESVSETRLIDGDQYCLTAVPNPGYEFDHWEDGSTDASRCFTVQGNSHTSLVAYFRPVDSGIQQHLAAQVQVIGRRVVLPDGCRIYNTLGQNLTHQSSLLPPGIYLVTNGTETCKVAVK